MRTGVHLARTTSLLPHSLTSYDETVRSAWLALGAASIAALLAGCRGRENLARGRPVRISSVRLGDPAGVVNGFVEWGSYAVHTKNDAPAWLTIDLGGAFPVGAVTIAGRGDGFLDERSAQITVEISSDGKAFRRVGACREIFTQAAPCEVSAGGAEARHVRLVHRSHLVLSEVEVFAAR
jgi:hypothetical protein